MTNFSIRFVPDTREMVIVRPFDATINQVILRTKNVEDIFDHLRVSKYEQDMEIYNEFG